MDRKTVLVVEDEEDSRNIYATLLRHHGYEVLEAEDGEHGVRLAREEHPDLILMDLRLPRLNGWSAGEWIKREPETAHIPLIALTVHASSADQERARASGFDSYLVKPCRPTRMLEEVRRFIGPSAARMNISQEERMASLRTARELASEQSPGHDLPPGLNPPMETLLRHLVEEGRVEVAGTGPDGEVRYKLTPGYTWEMVLERARALAEEIRQAQEGLR